MKAVPRHKEVLATFLVAALGLAVGSCAPATGIAIMSSSAGAATGAGIERTMGGKAHKLFVEPMANVEAAARDTLDRMALTIEETEDQEGGRTFKARAEKRQIEIELEPLTPLATRITVVAKRSNIFSPDAATAAEIIMQIAKTLEDGAKATASSASPGVGAGARR